MDGKRFETWGEEEAFVGGKELVPRNGDGHNKEIVFENKEEINKRNMDLWEKLKTLSLELGVAKDPEEKNKISGEILTLIAGTAGENYFELKKQQAST